MSLSVKQSLQKARSYTKTGKLPEARAIYQKILTKFPKNREAISGLKLLQNNGLVARIDGQEPPQDQVQAVIKLFTQGLFENTLIKIEQIQNMFPNSVLLFNICGATYTELGKFDRAIENYKKALIIKPDHVDALCNMGVAEQRKGDLYSAIKSYKRAVEINPHHATAYYNMGVIYKTNGDLKLALKCYKRAIKIQPTYAAAYNNMGNAFQAADKLEDAIDCFQRALAINPYFIEAHYNLGNGLRENNDLDAAVLSYKKAVEIKPTYAEAYNNIGNILREKGELKGATESFKQALKCNPTYAEAYHNFSKIKNYNKFDKQIKQMKAIYQDHDISDDERCHICFALAKVSEDLGELEKAFYHFREGNALRKKILSYDITDDQNLFATLIKVDSGAPQNAFLPPQRSAKITPIFILGMPRSGTTLTEQIISSHSKVTGAGELGFIEKFGSKIAIGEQRVTKNNLLNFRQNYLSSITRLADGNPFVTDKMPHNFRYVGLICRAFPEAKIIHLKRNAAATCWSNFKSYFAAASLGYCYNLDDLVIYYSLYEGLMKFWHDRYLSRIYDMDYDQLTIDQVDATKKLIHGLDLNWEEACLSPEKNMRSIQTASQQQIRKKVYKGSSQNWHKFEPLLDGAFNGLKI